MDIRRRIFLVALLLPLTLMAQKKEIIDFDAATLPDDLLEFMNKSTSDRDKQKDILRTVKNFSASFSAMDAGMQKRVTWMFNGVANSKMKGYPDICIVTRVLTAYAQAPNGGQNLDEWLKAMESLRKSSAKSKAVIEFVEFSETLLTNRILYSSNSSTWRFDVGTTFRLGQEDDKILVWFDTPADLIYSSLKDEDRIHGTTGVYDYKEGRWRGQGGRLDWTRTGLGKEACFADLSRYKLTTKFPKFTADSVMFTNTHYFSTPIMGRVEEMLKNAMMEEEYGYPRFRSYQKDFVIKNIMPDVDYRGSFMMNGAKFITASSKQAATLVFNRQGKAQLAVTAQKFSITAERLVSENAQVAFYVGEEDSITNTGITVRYTPQEHKVMLINDPKRNFYSPYIDTYHSLDIYSDVITWYTDRPGVEFSNISTGTEGNMVTFESSSYYTFRKYREIQGIDEISPVKRVYQFAESTSYNFPAADFANYIGLDMGQTLLMIHNLSRHGLVSYNEVTGRVLVKEKLEDYVKAFGKTKGFDYDALTLESSLAAADRIRANAELNIDDNLLSVHGVEQFVVSDSQYVVVHPLRGELKVGKNREITFDGRIDVGKFTMFVTKADFRYDKFDFDLPKVDSMFFYVPMFDNPEKEHLVLTPLYNLVGNLQVDMPNNHCGLTKNKQYPIFNSLENSFVYYDKSDIREGNYVRNRFYYTLHPFTINSLVDFVTDSLQFNGVLTSGNIFPDITYPLSVQHDYYLGFRVKTPAGGYPTYVNKGMYKGNISLDHSGLQAKGELDYLASHSTSKNYLFLLDSMSATTDTFYVREDGTYPDVQVARTAVHWVPYADSMAVSTIKGARPMRMYRGATTFYGRLDVMPRGTEASGIADVDEGTFRSSRFKMLAREMNAAVTDFSLRSKKLNTTAFTANDINSHVDYDLRRADLKMPNGPQRTDLQLVKQTAYADLFTWDIDHHTLDIVNGGRHTSEGLDAMDLRLRLPKRGDMPGARFVSTDEKQDGLTYNALHSVYRYEMGDLSSDGVFLISVADAAIAPMMDTVHVDRGGKMRQLSNAMLVCNVDSAWHLIQNVNMQITSSNSFKGSGYIDYVNDAHKPQRIYLKDISVDANGNTVGIGTISDSASFTLSSVFGFAGKVKVDGSHKYLHFEGGVRLLQHCLPREQVALLAYADYTDPEHIHISVPNEPTDWEGHRITVSILMDNVSLMPSAAFLSTEKVSGNEMLRGSGVLTYMGDRKMYMIASEAKLASPDVVIEPYLSLSTENCVVEGEGPVNFALKPTQASYYTYGTASVGIRNSDNDYVNTVFGITFPIAPNVVQAMSNALEDDLRLHVSEGSTNAEMRHALISLLGKEEGGKYYTEYSSTGKLPEIPKVMQSTLLFDNIRWQYSPALGLYYDGKVTLIGVGDNQLGVEVKLKAQITKRKNVQTMTFYVEAEKDHWYFFRYDLNSQELAINSSVGIWNDMIKAIPLDDRKISVEGKGTFRYFVGNGQNDVVDWLNYFTRTINPEE